MKRMKGPAEWYRVFSERPDFEPDDEQLKVVGYLQDLFEDLESFQKQQHALLSRTFGLRRVPRGIYIHGDVGRGKSVIMDGFFSCLPESGKRRVHFHEFMVEVHERMRQLSTREDPLRTVAMQIASQTHVLCFDEFHVSDIADAMILKRLFEFLMDQDITLVITSNYAPDDLYPEGLQRERFLPAISLLKEKLTVVMIHGDRDHRKRVLEHLNVYFHPLGVPSEMSMQSTFHALCQHPLAISELEVLGRRIVVRGAGEGVAWFGFDELCGGARSQRDYLELAARYRTLMLSDIPQLTEKWREAAFRLTWLVDIAYDRHIRLVISAESTPELLYSEELRNEESERTISRLMEMQTSGYLADWSPIHE